ncbi:hypothetical protein N658DRAFT_232531 [Parathielavia hyrcaniae]|uniref:Uncharacterized protein n=1 Tax=Parathielavia hyrcaniae TaxID=113614 RepID=A0AAN6T3K4_9PEZI|nr:hypothetical protein N658DRAFT_232531 [Parathielavia hyrcaniae]
MCLSCKIEFLRCTCVLTSSSTRKHAVGHRRGPSTTQFRALIKAVRLSPGFPHLSLSLQTKPPQARRPHFLSTALFCPLVSSNHSSTNTNTPPNLFQKITSAW